MEAGGFHEERSGTVLTALLVGFGAAVVVGIGWGLIVKWTGYEIGFAAWGVGFVVGTAVAFGAQGRRGMPFPAIAVALALGGILLGKYLAFVWIGQDTLGKLGLSLPVFSGATARLFWDTRSAIWSVWDLLWAGLAVVTAFRIPQRGAKPAPFFPVMESNLAAPGEPVTAVAASSADYERAPLHDDRATQENA